MNNPNLIKIIYPEDDAGQLKEPRIVYLNMAMIPALDVFTDHAIYRQTDGATRIIPLGRDGARRLRQALDGGEARSFPAWSDKRNPSPKQWQIAGLTIRHAVIEGDEYGSAAMERTRIIMAREGESRPPELVATFDGEDATRQDRDAIDALDHVARYVLDRSLTVNALYYRNDAGTDMIIYYAYAGLDTFWTAAQEDRGLDDIGEGEQEDAAAAVIATNGDAAE